MTDEAIAFLKTLNTMELVVLQKEARQIADYDSVNAILDILHERHKEYLDRMKNDS